MYKIIKIIKNDETLIKEFDTKEEALKFGEEYFNSTNERMTLVCVSRKENSNRELLFKTWR